MDKVDICKLCYETFDEYIRPRCLPCGHSFCTSCLNGVIEDGKLTCPKCKQIHRAMNGNEFSVNYALEEMILDTRKMVPRDETGGTSNNMQFLIEDQKISSQKLIAASDELELQVKRYDDFLLDKKSKHEEILQEIKDLSKRNEAVVKSIDDEHLKLTEMLREVEQLRQNIKDKLPDLDSASSTTNVVTSIAELDQGIAALEQCNENCRSDLPNASLISSSLRVLVDSASATLALKCGDEVPEIPSLPRSEFTITQKIAKIIGTGTINFQNLKAMSEPMKILLTKGRVYAIQLRKKNRSTRLELRGNNVYLHFLQDGKPPLNFHTIQHSELIENLDRDSTVVFMDLAWDDAMRGRVHIRLTHDTPLAHQFRILCTAEGGPCFANSKFYAVNYKGYNSECLHGGDYQFNNGEGGASILTGLKRDDGRYIRPFLTGIVRATNGLTEGPKSAQFNILTGAGDVLVNCLNVFGRVEDGLELLKEAANCTAGKVEIRDCGVMLNL